MCQLCPISHLATSARWPKPLEPSIADLTFLITCIHDEHEKWKSATTSTNASTNTNTNTSTQNTSTSTTTTNPASSHTALLPLLRDLSAALTSLTHERAAWWKSKTPLIKQLRDEVSGTSERKLTELQKINNAAGERIEGMEAKLGGFVRWSLGMEGGVGELLRGGEGVEGGGGVGR